MGFSNDLKSQHKTYSDNGSKIMAKINDKSAKPGNTSSQLKAMEDSAIFLLKEYKKKEPKAKKLVDFIMKSLPTLRKASFDSLEKDWHDGGVLTEDVVGMDLVDEDNEKHLDPMHTLVHVLMTKAAIDVLPPLNR